MNIEKQSEYAHNIVRTGRAISLYVERLHSQPASVAEVYLGTVRVSVDYKSVDRMQEQVDELCDEFSGDHTITVEGDATSVLRLREIVEDLNETLAPFREAEARKR